MLAYIQPLEVDFEVGCVQCQRLDVRNIPGHVYVGLAAIGAFKREFGCVII